MTNSNFKITKLRICYFGIYNPEFSRNKIYISGLRDLGVSVIECRDVSRGLRKYWRLFRKLWDLRNQYDVLIVGYPGHVMVPFARLLTSKPVVLDALCSMYEGVMISRKQFSRLSIKTLYIRCVDWLAFHLAHLTFVETEKQIEFISKTYHVSKNKLAVVYTGVDDTVFYKDASVQKNSIFTAVFRGKFLPEAGVLHIIDAAKILEDKEVDFLIIGNGYLEKEIQEYIKKVAPKNLTLISRHVPVDELRIKMFQAHVSLGQFENHERLERTIPHKAFESLALGLPYITAHTEGVGEIFEDGKTVLFVSPADPQDLADKIYELKDSPKLQETIGNNGYLLYKKRFLPQALAKTITGQIRQLLLRRLGR